MYFIIFKAKGVKASPQLREPNVAVEINKQSYQKRDSSTTRAI